MTVLLIVAEKVIKKQIHNCAVQSGIAISFTGIGAQFYRNMQCTHKKYERGKIMNKNDKDFLVQKIRTQYTEKKTKNWMH